MSDATKVRATHNQRAALVYVRQSSPSQVERNRESTQRQYALVERALELGWRRDQISVIDDDLGLSGASSAARLGLRAHEHRGRLKPRGHCAGVGSIASLAQAQGELATREQQRPRAWDGAQAERIRSLGGDLERVWYAPSTEDRDRKELLRALLEEVSIALERDLCRAHITLRWRSGTLTQLDVEVLRFKVTPKRTDEDTVELIKRLAHHYPDAIIAGILSRQGRKSAHGERFSAKLVADLRRHRSIPRYEPPAEPPKGELVNISKAAEILKLAPSTIHRWLAAGFIAGEQITPGAPWQIRITEELRARFVEQEPPGYLAMQEATKYLGVSRQTVLQRVKRGELEAVHLVCGRRKGLRIKVISSEPDLLSQSS